jgi:hypothetical protein
LTDVDKLLLNLADKCGGRPSSMVMGVQVVLILFEITITFTTIFSINNIIIIATNIIATNELHTTEHIKELKNS